MACVYAFFAALMIYRDMGPLQGRGWLREGEQRAFGLGLRVVAFAVIGFVAACIARQGGGLSSGLGAGCGDWLGFGLPWHRLGDDSFCSPT